MNSHIDNIKTYEEEVKLLDSVMKDMTVFPKISEPFLSAEERAKQRMQDPKYRKESEEWMEYIRKEILEITNIDGNGGFDIKLDNGNYASVYDVLYALRKVLDRMWEEDKND